MPKPGLETSEETQGTASSTQEEKRFRVMVNSGESKASKRDITLTVNGVNCLVARDREVLLKPEFLEALQNAKELDYAVIDENGKPRIVKGANRFSYAILGEEIVPLGSLDTCPVTNANATA